MSPRSHRRLAVVMLAMVACRSSTPLPSGGANDPKPREGSPPPSRPRERREGGVADSGVDVLEEELTVHVDDQGRGTRTYRIRFRIREERAIEAWSTISQSWAPWHQGRPEVSARVTTPDGRVVQLDPSTISDAPERELYANMFSDRRTLRAPLPHLSVGTVVERVHTIRDTQPYFGAGSNGTYYFGAYAPLEKTRLVLELPARSPLAYQVRGIELTPVIEEHEGRKRLTFEAGPLAPVEEAEPFAPADAVTWPHVAFSTHASWAELGSTYGRVVEQRLAGANVEALVAGARSAPSKDAQVRQLVRELHRRIRYTGLELGEAALIPRSPAETLERGYGDCKDKAVLLVAMLRALGIDAHLALLRAGGPDAEPELPGIESLNHAIVHLPSGPVPWIDATFEEGPADTLPVSVYGRRALIAKEGSPGLLQITPAAASQHRYREVREVRMPDFGPAKIIETSRATGNLEVWMREGLAEAPESELRERLTAYAKDVHKADKVSKVERRNGGDVEQRFELLLEMEGAKTAATNDYSASVSINLAVLFSWLPDYLLGEQAPKRALDFAWPFAHDVELQYVISPPLGFVVRTLPDPLDLTFGPAKLWARFEKGAGGKVTASYHFDTGKPRYTAAEVREFHEGLEKFYESPAHELTFDHEGMQLVQTGKLAEGLARHREAISKEPKNAFHHVHLAEALLIAGFGEEARREGRVAVELAPDVMLAHFKLGWILLHDALGRHLGPGSDLAGALAQFRRCKELDPKSQPARQNIAYILEHNSKRVRYGQGAKLDDAVAEYDALVADLNDHSLDLGRLLALYYSGRLEEVHGRGKDTPASVERHGVMLAATAALRGTAATLSELGALGLDPTSRQRVLATASDLLVRIRRYSLAAELLSIASAGSPAAIELQGQVALLAKVKPQDARLDPSRPEGALVEMMTAVTAGDEARALGILSSRARAEAEAEEKASGESRQLAIGISQAQRALGKLNLPPEVIFDLLLSTWQLERDGSDEEGHRIRVRSPGAEAMDWFFVLENGKAKVRGNGGYPAGIAAEVFHRAGRGDLAGAKRWRGWLRTTATGTPREHWAAKDLQLGEPDQKVGIQREAALWMAGLPGISDAALPVLEELHRAHPESEAMSRLFALALQRAARPGAALEVLEKARRRLPENRDLLFATFGALNELKRTTDLEKLAAQWLSSHPEDNAVRERLAGALQGARSIAVYEEALAGGKGSATTLNNYAWAVFIHGGPIQRGIEAALRSVNETGRRSSFSLHTLAALYAEAGMSAEALQALRSSLDLRDGEPQHHDWLVIGRVAEHCGLRDAAVAAYRRTIELSKETDDPLVSMAKKRLVGLGTKP